MTLADLIAQMEGWNVSGSVAQRNNNPGNLRASSLATGTDSRGYAIFPSASVGFQALQNQIQMDSARGLSLRDFTYKYAPPSENDTSNYLGFLSNGLGVGPDTPLANLVDSQGGGSSLDYSGYTPGDSGSLANISNSLADTFGGSGMTVGLMVVVGALLAIAFSGR